MTVEVSNDTKEMLESLEELRRVPDELQKIIDLGEAKGISSQERAELVYGIGQIVAVMRDVANELEQMVKRF